MPSFKNIQSLMDGYCSGISCENSILENIRCVGCGRGVHHVSDGLRFFTNKEGDLHEDLCCALCRKYVGLGLASYCVLLKTDIPGIRYGQLCWILRPLVKRETPVILDAHVMLVATYIGPCENCFTGPFRRNGTF